MQRAVLVVDDHSLIAQGLSLALRAEDLDVHVVMEPDIEQLLALARVHHVALAIVDLQFGGDHSEGLGLIGRLSALTPVLTLTGVTDAAVLGACLEAGSIGVASKSEPFDRVLDRIRAALDGEPVQGIREREELLAAARQRRAEDERRLAPFRALSRRESEVLDLLAAGVAAETIAERSYVSVATVRTQIQAILRKLEVTSQLAAVARAHDCGWRGESRP